MLVPEFITPKLSVSDVLYAYPLGFFPWSSSPCAWYNPAYRMVFFPDKIYDQKSLRRYKNRFLLKANKDFTPLMRLCARKDKTWIDETFISVYSKLFDQGVAQCVSVYENDTLVGGIYGLLFGKVFFGESMVSLVSNASKYALISLCKALQEYDFLIDAQVANPHLAFMGGKNLEKNEFLQIISHKTKEKSGFKDFTNLILNKG